MKAFETLSRFYDYYNGADYEHYTEFIKSCVEKYSLASPKILLDLCCGTGELLKRLSDSDVAEDFIGVDISENMLAVASEKLSGRALLLCQSMTELDLYGTIHCCVCTYDSLGYLDQRSDFEKVFSNVALFLEEGGLFIFDISTKYRFEKVLDGSSFVNEEDCGMLVCRFDYVRSRKRLDMYLSVFEEEENGLYSRYDEGQSVYYYGDRFVRKTAENAGFELCAAYGDTSFGEVTPDSDKTYYVFRRKKWKTFTEQ